MGDYHLNILGSLLKNLGSFLKILPCFLPL